MEAWLVFLFIAVAPGTVEVQAVPVTSERACRAIERQVINIQLPGGAVVVAAQCEGGA